MQQETLQNFFVEEIRDLYDAEKQLVKALPKIAKAAASEELTEAIGSHLHQTQTHVTRLEEIFEHLGVPAKGKPCKGMKGLLEEGSETMQAEDAGPIRDLAIIAAAQKVEHYEISAYGTARTLAEQLGLNDAVDLLQRTEDEEKEADEKLTEVAGGVFESSGMEEEAGEEMATSGVRSGHSSTARNGKRKPSR